MLRLPVASEFLSFGYLLGGHLSNQTKKLTIMGDLLGGHNLSNPTKKLTIMGDLLGGHNLSIPTKKQTTI